MSFPQLNANDFEELINSHGYQVYWEKSYVCPQYEKDRSSCRPDCLICQGTNYFWVPFKKIMSILTALGAAKNPVDFSNFETGTLQATTSSADRLSENDRLVLINTTDPYTENIKYDAGLKGYKTFFLPYSIDSIYSPVPALLNPNNFQYDYSNFILRTSLSPAPYQISIRYIYFPMQIVIKALHVNRQQINTIGSPSAKVTNFPRQFHTQRFNQFSKPALGSALIMDNLLFHVSGSSLPVSPFTSWIDLQGYENLSFSNPITNGLKYVILGSNSATLNNFNFNIKNSNPFTPGLANQPSATIEAFLNIQSQSIQSAPLITLTDYYNLLTSIISPVITTKDLPLSLSIGDKFVLFKDEYVPRPSAWVCFPFNSILTYLGGDKHNHSSWSASFPAEFNAIKTSSNHVFIFKNCSWVNKLPDLIVSIYVSSNLVQLQCGATILTGQIPSTVVLSSFFNISLILLNSTNTSSSRIFINGQEVTLTLITEDNTLYNQLANRNVVLNSLSQDIIQINDLRIYETSFSPYEVLNNFIFMKSQGI